MIAAPAAGGLRRHGRPVSVVPARNQQMMKVLLSSAAAAALSVSVGLLALAADAPKPAKPAAGANPPAAAKPAANPAIPHAQKAPPGPALSPDEAMAKMKLPPGFKVECVVAEPLVVNPTAFTWDDRGRLWVTESVEYPRRDPGKGNDRVVILEDTDGDGKVDKRTVFKDGLNIPCGVVHGNGGVYITNSPDILFLQDTDGDGKADKEEVILTGFGRADTHELPNSLTWGPDGWLYGMNGVFNPATVKDPASDKVYKFTCAVWRYHPPTKRFELFAEGTSNPWGLDYDRAGEWFISCCVIDHLFHVTQSGYYHRQGGAYPANVQQAKLPSICTERHQQAAYAGLCVYDADAYPAEYRGRLLMGNLHGSALNQDVLTRRGSTFVQKNVKGPNDSPLNDGVGNLDFLQANDAWFMPVAQKIGPDGCVYVMDWYDRYHCYQDANRDSPGLDRDKGRIYRISYNDTPRAKPFDLTKASDDELVKQLGNPNVWWRREAQRLLNERRDVRGSAYAGQLAAMATDPKQPNNANLHALWLLVSQNAVGDDLLTKLLSHEDETTRAWGVRAVGNAGKASAAVYDKLKAMATTDPSPSVRVQIAVAAGRLAGTSNAAVKVSTAGTPADAKADAKSGAKGEADTSDPLPLLLALLSDPANAKDPLIPSIAYMNLRPLAATRGEAILAGLAALPDVDKSFGDTTVKWVKQAIATSGNGADAIVTEVSRAIKAAKEPKKAAQALDTLIDGLASLPPEQRARKITPELRKTVLGYLVDANAKGDAAAARVQAATVALWWEEPAAVDAARQIVASADAGIEARVALTRTLADTKNPANAKAFAALAADKDVPLRLRLVAIDALGSVGQPPAATAVVDLYSSLPPDLKPAALNALVRTTAGANALLAGVEAKKVPAAEVSANHARSMQALGYTSISERLAKVWGTVKTDRDPERVKVVERMRKVVTAAGPKADAAAGWKVFEARCAQCHTIYGKGGQVGPDLTGVGRDDLDAILTNVLDPNLVIGASYQVNVAKTKDGDVIAGLLVEQSDQQVVLKDATKQTAIPRSNLAKLTVQNLSLMPEGLEATMTEPEFRDLVAFLLTRQPPK
jgi:putative membrane-bound dehydrogenase-like protein